MKIYVASSWRNERYSAVVKRLREEGFEAYDFKETDDFGWGGFSWGDIDPKWKNWTSVELIKGLQHPLAEQGFKRDKEALDECDICILVMPCGRSAHLELGYAVGKNKKTIVLLDNGEPELMYKFVDLVADSIEGVILWCYALKGEGK